MLKELCIRRLKNFELLKSTLPTYVAMNLLKRPCKTDLVTIDEILITCVVLIM